MPTQLEACQGAEKGPSGSSWGGSDPASGVRCPAWGAVSLPGPVQQGAWPPFCDTSPPGPDTQGHWRFLGSQGVCRGAGIWNTRQTPRPRAPDPAGQQLTTLRSTREARGLGQGGCSQWQPVEESLPGPLSLTAQAPEDGRQPTERKRVCSGVGPWCKRRSTGGAQSLLAAAPCNSRVPRPVQAEGQEGGWPESQSGLGTGLPCAPGG